MNSVGPPFEGSRCISNFHLYVLLIDFAKIGISRTRLMLDLRQQGVQTQVHYIPIYTQPFYQKEFGCAWGNCPNAEKYYEQCLSLPLFAGMKDKEVEKVIAAVRSALASTGTKKLQSIKQ
jgi:perosamine synthetase